MGHRYVLQLLFSASYKIANNSAIPEARENSTNLEFLEFKKKLMHV
jgi:hypothetical protein